MVPEGPHRLRIAAYLVRTVMYFDITARTWWHIGTRDTSYTNVLFTLKAGEVLESMGWHVPDCVHHLDKHLI